MTKKKKKPTWLKGLKLGEVSLVNRGANQHAAVGIWKSADGPPQTQEGQMADKTELEKVLDDLAKADASIVTLTQKVADLEKAAGEKDADLRARDRDMQDKQRMLDVELAKNADPEEELLKGMSEPAKVAFLAQKATNEKLVKRLDKEADDRHLLEIGKSFDVDFGGLPIKGTDAAPILKIAKENLDDDQMDELNRLLKAGSEALKDLAALKGMTNGNKEPTSAEAKMDKLAKERAAKDNTSFEKAYSVVLKENPDLYSAFDDERGFYSN